MNLTKISKSPFSKHVLLHNILSTIASFLTNYKGSRISFFLCIYLRKQGCLFYLWDLTETFQGATEFNSGRRIKWEKMWTFEIYKGSREHVTPHPTLNFGTNAWYDWIKTFSRPYCKLTVTQFPNCQYDDNVSRFLTCFE